MIRTTMRQPGSGFKGKFPFIVEQSRTIGNGLYSSFRNEPFGMFLFGAGSIKVIVSDGLGWDHVSVSLNDRCPTWHEMNWIKNLFFDPECCVVQFHPPESRYINNHEFVLHMWHKQGHEYELPPRECV